MVEMFLSDLVFNMNKSVTSKNVTISSFLMFSTNKTHTTRSCYVSFSFIAVRQRANE